MPLRLQNNPNWIREPGNPNDQNNVVSKGFLLKKMLKAYPNYLKRRTQTPSEICSFLKKTIVVRELRF